ncbi:MAG TPA: hypothetical protein VN760_05255 [Casimicrobiaceae bacterium]|nr:hypothetical protein [Casimicrobiaceae bacterium]
MRTSLISGSIVESVVTLAAAALMTFAGFEMLTGMSAKPEAAAGAVQSVVSPAPKAEETRG